LSSRLLAVIHSIIDYSMDIIFQRSLEQVNWKATSIPVSTNPYAGELTMWIQNPTENISNLPRQIQNEIYDTIFKSINSGYITLLKDDTKRVNLFCAKGLLIDLVPITKIAKSFSRDHLLSEIIEILTLITSDDLLDFTIDQTRNQKYNNISDWKVLLAIIEKIKEDSFSVKTIFAPSSRKKQLEQLKLFLRSNL